MLMMSSVADSGDGQRNLNHAKVYVTKYHHAVWSTQYTGNKGDCAVLNVDQYRSNDFYQFSGPTLVEGSLIPGMCPNGVLPLTYFFSPDLQCAVDWDWGKAASSPLAMYGDGDQNVCNK